MDQVASRPHQEHEWISRRMGRDLQGWKGQNEPRHSHRPTDYSEDRGVFVLAEGYNLRVA